MTGKKYDKGKLRMDLIPPEALEGMAKILTMGAEKYGPNNWQGLENFEERYSGALMRHLNEMRKGELVDDESGEPHAYHVLCNAAFLAWKAYRVIEGRKMTTRIPVDPTIPGPPREVPDVTPVELAEIDSTNLDGPPIGGSETATTSPEEKYGPAPYIWVVDDETFYTHSHTVSRREILKMVDKDPNNWGLRIIYTSGNAEQLLSSEDTHIINEPIDRFETFLLTTPRDPDIVGA